RWRIGEEHVRRQSNQLGRTSTNIGVSDAPSNVQMNFVFLAPPQSCQRLSKCPDASLILGICFKCSHQNASPLHRGLLRARRERPCDCRAADKGDEFPSPHSVCAPQTHDYSLPHPCMRGLCATAISAAPLPEWAHKRCPPS